MICTHWFCLTIFAVRYINWRRLLQFGYPFCCPTSSVKFLVLTSEYRILDCVLCWSINQEQLGILYATTSWYWYRFITLFLETCICDIFPLKWLSTHGTQKSTILHYITLPPVYCCIILCMQTERSELLSTTPVTYLILDLNPPIGSQPSLMALDEVKSLFHEVSTLVSY